MENMGGNFANKLNAARTLRNSAEQEVMLGQGTPDQQKGVNNMLDRAKNTLGNSPKANAVASNSARRGALSGNVKNVVAGIGTAPSLIPGKTNLKTGAQGPGTIIRGANASIGGAKHVRK
jgi:hypothetical protein